MILIFCCLLRDGVERWAKLGVVDRCASHDLIGEQVGAGALSQHVLQYREQ